MNSVYCVDNCTLPLILVNGIETSSAKEICESTLKPLSLATLVDFEEDNLLSKYMEVGVDHNDNFTVEESSLKELGFISPIKAFKGSGSRYFLGSSSKVLMDSVSSGFKRLSTPINLVESVLGTNQSDVIGSLREVDAHCKASL